MTSEAIRELYDPRRDEAESNGRRGIYNMPEADRRIAGFEALDRDIEDIFGASVRKVLI